MNKLKPFIPLALVAGALVLTTSGTVNVPALIASLGITLRDGLFAGIGALLMAVLRGR